MIRKYAVWMLAFILFAPAAQGASFNCRTAEAPDEILICQSPELSGLDERRASISGFAMSSRARAVSD
jgi:uncharacterized protein